MRPVRRMLDIAVALRAVAQTLEGNPKPSWAELDALARRVMDVAEDVLAARDSAAGAPEPPKAGRRHLAAVPTPPAPPRGPHGGGGKAT